MKTGRAPMTPTVKHDPSIMISGAISARGVSPLAMVKETIDSLVYQEIVDGYLLPTMETLYPEGWFLQQDNAPCHVSKSSMAFFMKRVIEVMDWLPNSPDLNPIENLRAILKKKVGCLYENDCCKMEG